MQKKLALAAITACFTFVSIPTVHASPVCPFYDNFRINSPQPLHVIRAEVDGNLRFEQFSHDFFRLSCADLSSRASGNIYLEIGMNNDVKCAISLRDGPYEMNPTVTMVSCGGTSSPLYYVGMDHTLGSYDYTLKFTI